MENTVQGAGKGKAVKIVMKLFSRKKNREMVDVQERLWTDKSNYDKYENLDSEEEPKESSEEEPEEAEYDRDEEVFLRDKKEKLLFAEDCCEEILEASRRTAETKKEYKAVNGYLEDIRIITELEGEKKEALFYHTNRILNLKNDKESYRTYGTKIPESKYNYIQANEQKMPDILKELHDDEAYLQTLKTDLHHIEGEKAGLTYERKDYDRQILMIKNCVGIMLGTAALLLGGMFYFHLNSDYDFTIGIFASVAILALALCILVVMYQNCVKEIKLTERKINKAIGLLNKYRLLYVNMKNTVDYTCKKIGIRDSYELGNYWRLYVTAKKEQQAYTKMSDELYQEQKEFNDLIHSLNLYDESVWNFQMSAIIDEGEMKEIQDNLNKRKKGLRRTMDYNKKRSEKCKQKVKNLIKDEPELAPDILRIVEEKEKAIYEQSAREVS
ncbi:hypothetical protein AALB81_04480 [Lachnospiraceae bacterium 48-33]